MAFTYLHSKHSKTLFIKTALLFILLITSPLLFSQNTTILDYHFEDALIDLGLDDNLDGSVQTSHIDTLTYLDVSGYDIFNLSGIEDFSSLNYLNCGENQLTILNLSANTQLQALHCGGNQLTTLDLSSNIALNYLYCENNNLSSIDVGQCYDLRWLACMYNQLTSLDVSNCSVLEHLWCQYNLLTSLDVSQCPELDWLDCSYNQLTSLDVSNNPLLHTLFCYNNLLETVDISNNPNIYCTDFENNQIINIVLNPNVSCLKLANNQLTSLDISGYGNLVNLDIRYNPLICLNLANGNNQNLSLEASESPDLTCVQVDNVNNPLTWYSMFPESVLSEDCTSDCSMGVGNLSSAPKKLHKVLDLMGRETTFKPNTPLIYLYSDGSTEKILSVE